MVETCGCICHGAPRKQKSISSTQQCRIQISLPLRRAAISLPAICWRLHELLLPSLQVSYSQLSRMSTNTQAGGDLGRSRPWPKETCSQHTRSYGQLDPDDSQKKAAVASPNVTSHTCNLLIWVPCLETHH
jgi:hypothetical protein